MIQWHKFTSREELFSTLTTEITEQLARALTQRGVASWIVSGGSTPLPLFERMSATPLDWLNIYIALVDERWVEPDHPRSNEAFVRNNLLQNKAVGATFVGMKNSADSPWDATAEINQRYAQLPQPFDSVLLGMGPDGHTASFFPEAKGLDAALDPSNNDTCVALTANKSEVTGAEVLRMSISAGAIARSRQVILLITGADKLAVLEHALSNVNDRQSLEPSLPVAKLAQLVPIEVFWAP